MSAFMDWLRDNSFTGFIFLIASSGVIQILPIKIYPWDYIFKKIGNAFNKDLAETVNDLRSDLKNHIKEDRDNDATRARQRILRFETDLGRGGKYTREYWAEILRDVDKYESYCEHNKDYKNSYAVDAIKHIRKEHDKALTKNDFL